MEGAPPVYIYIYILHVPTYPPSSTNLTELAKAVRLLGALFPDGLSGDELLKAARALAAACAALLNAAQPENMKVCVHGGGGGLCVLAVVCGCVSECDAAAQPSNSFFLSSTGSPTATSSCRRHGGDWRTSP